jgi:acetyl esterase/lipase
MTSGRRSSSCAPRPPISGVDPERIGMMGDSAGAHLVALVGLDGAEPEFGSGYRDDPNATTPVNVKAVVGFYGVRDMLAQWQHDQIARPRDNVAEKCLGASPMQNRRVYFESSPISVCESPASARNLIGRLRGCGLWRNPLSRICCDSAARNAG